MVFVDKCEICGNKGTFVYSAYLTHFSVCPNKQCNIQILSNSIFFQIENEKFIKYRFDGNIENIKIPRSNGSVSMGKIVYGNTIDDPLEFKNSIPVLRVSFVDNNRLNEKYILYSQLALYNERDKLPHIDILSVYDKKEITKECYEFLCNKQKELDNLLDTLNITDNTI